MRKLRRLGKIGLGKRGRAKPKEATTDKWTPEARAKLSRSMKKAHRTKTKAGIPWTGRASGSNNHSAATV
jgi:hypothetical protein